MAKIAHIGSEQKYAVSTDTKGDKAELLWTSPSPTVFCADGHLEMRDIVHTG